MWPVTYRVNSGFKGFKGLLVIACLLQALSLQVSFNHLFQKSLVGTSWTLEQWQCLPLFQENYRVRTLPVKGMLMVGGSLCLLLTLSLSWCNAPTAQPPQFTVQRREALSRTCEVHSWWSQQSHYNSSVRTGFVQVTEVKIIFCYPWQSCSAKLLVCSELATAVYQPLNFCLANFRLL